jgi:hypothetical protein
MKINRGFRPAFARKSLQDLILMEKAGCGDVHLSSQQLEGS